MTNNDGEEQLTASGGSWAHYHFYHYHPTHIQDVKQTLMVDILLLLGMCIVERSSTVSSKSYRKVRDAEGNAQRFYVGCLSGFMVGKVSGPMNQLR